MKKMVFFVFGLISFKSFAQGCSDAGFCSLGVAHEATTEKATKNSFEVGLGIASGEEEVGIFSQFLSYTRELNSAVSLNLKVTGQSASKDGVSNFNAGDAFVSANYKIKTSSEDKKWSVLMGVKIPLTDGNDTYEGFSLPMVYQSSLGTFDAIAGLSHSYKRWDFSTAVQIPLSDNKNQFGGSPDFSSTNEFKRQADGLLRAMYTLYSDSKKFTFKPNLLLIYHFGEDSYLNELNQRIDIDGSSGLTANANVIVNYKLSDASSLESSLAVPFIVRDERPDGLTRSFTLGVSYKIGF